MGAVIKVQVRYGEPFWRRHALTALAESTMVA
jgi:hypothetical protein